MNADTALPPIAKISMSQVGGSVLDPRLFQPRERPTCNL
jgi:hypothetical protein